MKRLIALCLVALCLFPGNSLAAEAPISLGEYQQRLEQVVQRLQSAQRGGAGGGADLAAARQLLMSMPAVTTESGARALDLGPLAAGVAAADPGTSTGRKHLTDAVALAREYRSAASRLAEPGYRPAAGARQRLERALAAAQASQDRASLLERLRNWWNGLFRHSTSAATAASVGWGAVLIGVAGIALLAFFLARGLGGHTAGSDLAPGARPAGQRPLTPPELRQQARALAENGQYREALSTLHLAVLQHYDRLSLLRYVPAQTNREHVRQLRRRQIALAPVLQDLCDRVDAALYGGQPVGQEEYVAAEQLSGRLWQEGEVASKSAEATPGASSLAPSP